MKTIFPMLALASLVAAPAVAIQQPASRQAAPPHTNAGELTLYEMTNYNGDAMTIDAPRPTVHTDWNIRAISVHPGDSWQICARARFRDCITLNRSVNDASMIGIEGQIGSARPSPPPAAAPALTPSRANSN